MGLVKPQFRCRDTSVSAFPWVTSDNEKIFLILNDIRTDINKTRSDVMKINTDVMKIDADLQTTKANFMNVLVGITIAIAVIGGIKTVFESIEYIPTIPSKITNYVQEGKMKNLEREVDALRKELRNFRK